MMTFRSRLLKKYLNFILGSILIFFATNVNMHLGILILIAFVPLFLMDDIVFQFAASLVYFAVNFFWFIYYWPIYFNVLLYIYLSLFWLAFWLFVKFVKNSRLSFVFVPLVFVFVEFARMLGPIGFVSGSPAYALWRIKPVYPIVKLGGIWLLDFIVIYVNYFVYDIIRRKKIKKHILFVVVLMLAVYLYPLSAPPMKYAFNAIILGTNITPQRKWQKKFSSNIDTWYLKMIEKAAAPYRSRKLDFIIFPETATSRYLLKNAATLDFYKKIAKTYGAVVIIGTKDYERLPSGRYRYYNAAVAIYANGDVHKYYKMHLVPFAERRIFLFPRSLNKAGPFEQPGNIYTVFPDARYPFSVLICYETTYPILVRHFRRNGAELFFNISNEGALIKSRTVSRQLMRETLFRALENNVLIIKSANRGISALFYPNGEYKILGAGNENKAFFVHIAYPNH